MLGRFIGLIGVRARALIVLLALLVAGNVIFQMWTHKTTALTAWKGGGFGMYTEPHADTRSVWLTFEDGQKTTQLRLWPQDPRMTEWRTEVSLKGSAALGKVTTLAGRFRFYPRQTKGQELLALSKRIRWRENLPDGVLPREGKTFDLGQLSLQVYENVYDINAESLSKVAIYPVHERAGS